MNQDTYRGDITEMEILTQYEKNEKRKNPNNVISCIPCSMTFQDYLKVTQHIKSEEHSIVSLATGIYFNGQAKVIESFTDSFPEHHFCILCSFRSLNFPSFSTHLEGSPHKNVVQLLTDICRRRREAYTYNCLKTYTSKRGKGHKKAEQFISKIINVEQIEYVGDSYAFVDFDDSSHLRACYLCNIYFNSRTLYKEHLKSLTHKRMELFMIKISHTVNGMNIISVGTVSEASYTFSNSFYPMYYCELCDRWLSQSESYDNHIIGDCHIRIEELKMYLFTKIRNGRKSDAQSLVSTSSYTPPKNYCKLCATWRLPDKRYALHLKDNRHQTIECFVNNLKDNEKNLINAYIDAQARGRIDASFYCKLCQYLYHDFESYKQHLDSEKHKLLEPFSVKEKEPIKECCCEEVPRKTLAQNQGICVVQCISFVKFWKYYLMVGKYKISQHCDSYRQSLKRMLHKTKNVDICFMMQETNNNFSRRPHYCNLFNYSSWEMDKVQQNCIEASRKHYSMLGKHKISQLLTSQVLHKRKKNIVSSICFVTCETNSYSSPQQHYCELCNLSFDSHHYGKHLIGVKHQTMKQMLSSKRRLRNTPRQGFYCKLCNSCSPDTQHFSWHLMSKEHQTNMLNGKEKCPKHDIVANNKAHPLKYNCELCDVFNPSFKHYNQHLESERHKNNKCLLYCLTTQSLASRILNVSFQIHNTVVNSKIFRLNSSLPILYQHGF